MRLLVVGDVVGRLGRKAFARYTRELKEKYKIVERTMILIRIANTKNTLILLLIR